MIHPNLVAYVGQDELGSGIVGLKQALVPAGLIPLVAIESDSVKLTRGYVIEQMQMPADAYGKAIRLVRYAPVEVFLEIEPREARS